VQPDRPLSQQAAPYQKLNTREKFDVFVRHTYSPYTFGAAAFNAGIAQATGAWRSYGGGMEGYGKRFGAALADNESGELLGRFVFPALLHQDPRYLRAGQGGTGHRIGYAVTRILVTRGDSGNKQVNASLLLSAFASAGLANTYYPREERGPGDTMARAGGGLLSTAGMNILREFWPDIRAKFRKHEPEKVRKMEQKPAVHKLERMVQTAVGESPCPAGQKTATDSDKPADPQPGLGTKKRP